MAAMSGKSLLLETIGRIRYSGCSSEPPWRPAASAVVPDPTKPIAVVFLQPHCNMRCEFCVTEDDFDVMTFAQAVELLTNLQRKRVRTVTLGGGEPFTWPGDVRKLAQHGKELGLFVQVGTNGVDLPSGFAELPEFDRYVLPLESVDPAVHDELRQHRLGHHRVILDRLHELGCHGKSVTISTVLTARNCAGLEALAEHLRGYQERFHNVHAWHLYHLLERGRGGSVHGAALRIPVEEYASRCARAQALGLPFEVYRRQDMYRSRTVGFHWSVAGAIVANDG